VDEPLAGRLRSCGPVLDAAAADRALSVADQAAEAGGWMDQLRLARPALRPVLGSSSYLADLVRRRPERLGPILREPAPARLSAILDRVSALAVGPADIEAVKRDLRGLKAEIHLLTAMADLGGVWGLDEVTGALTRFADAALHAALAVVARAEVELGRLAAPAAGAEGPVPGLFCIAMGKYGAFELNYSSDIDFSIFYEPQVLPLADGVEHGAFALRLTQSVAEVLQQRTPDGYVFRVDLRLRPDPASTPPAMPVSAALDYYQSVGQNWERAAFIKARACGGDVGRGAAFLEVLQPFIWRRNLDFASIADIHAIKRQIHVYKDLALRGAKGCDLKLGPGGIREIEFYAQTQQLILGGRDASLRASRTVDALAALAKAGHVAPATAAELTADYQALRALEHRAQMIGDEQTHKLPESDVERRRIAALWGEGDLRRFDRTVGALLKRVNRRYGELFADDEDLSSRFGSLVFTGVEDDPETLKTLARMGFSDPARISATIRSWHHGRIGATRTEQGRELFTRLAPKLLEAAHAVGAPDTAFLRFAEFFASLNAGVQVQSMFLAKPKLFELVVQVMAFAPQLAATLARRPAALDAMLDQAFFAPFAPGEDEQALGHAARRAGPGFEAVMDAVRRAHRELAFRIGVQVMSGLASAAEAGPAFADLADACIRILAPAALAETERLGGVFPGQAAVVALGKCGSREMTAGSDLDLMTIYRPDDAAAASSLKGWSGETFYARFTQRLIAALSAPTAEGGLYEVDMRLRPSGSAGPVAVSQVALESYYAGQAETWEFLALTRARVVWATSEAYSAVVSGAIEAALRRPREPLATARDVAEMRDLMARERPPSGFWDLKLAPGGLVDVEFAAQYLQIVAAADGGPLRPNTGEALAAFGQSGRADAGDIDALLKAWSLQQDLSQILKVGFQDGVDPGAEPSGFKRLLAHAAHLRSYPMLRARLVAVRRAALDSLRLLIPVDWPTE
jgi:glutamate-ammonia-ligase adenylyltransferase